jgi:EmrB/QacA subfamily drug resistance transporter
MAERSGAPATRAGRLTLAAMIVVVSMTFIDMTIVAIAAPDIQQALGLSSTGLQWMVSSYLVSLAALFALGGRLADVVGHRTMVITGTILFTFASIMCGATPTGSIAEAWLITFRVIQGAGAAFMFPAALAIVVASFPIERRGRAIAIFFGFAGLLTAVGPFAGGYLTQWTWRSIFWINVPVAIVGLILTFIAKVENSRMREPIDWPGAVLIAAGMAASVIGLQQASTWGWTSTATLACIIGGAVLIGLFFEFERHRPHPLIRVSFFSMRTFTAQNIVLLFASAAFVPLFFFASIYAQVGLGWSTSNAGLYLLTFFAGFAPGVQVGGRLLDKGRARTAVVWGAFVAAAGLWAWSARLQDLSENQQWPWIVVAGFGLGLVIGSANTDAINQVPAENYGEATGVTQTARNYGAALGLAILGTVLSNTLRTKIEGSLATLGIDKSQADGIAASLQGSGGGKSSSAISQLGSNAQQAFQMIRLDFAQASQVVFRGLAMFMLISGVAAVIGLRRGRLSGGAGASGASGTTGTTGTTEVGSVERSERRGERQVE